ncbi:MAG: membrane protein [Candidatus Velthaea sp.]
MTQLRPIDMLNKVPQVTAFFWIIKVLATTVGETFADFLSTKLNLGLVTTSYVLAALFLIALVFQLRLKKYVPAMYWTVVVLISVVGTLASDLLVDKLGMGLQTSSIMFAGILALVFAIWWYSQRTLSVHAITTTKRELFYWAAILFTFALGTSAGDFLAEATGFGYPIAALMFAGLIALTALAYYVFKIDGVLAFWIAYILTRPLGASTGDLLSQPVDKGGLGFGTTITSLTFLVVIVGLVTYLTRNPAVESIPQELAA